MKRFFAEIFNEFLSENGIDAGDLHQKYIPVMDDFIQAKLPDIEVYISLYNSSKEEFSWFVASLVGAKRFSTFAKQHQAEDQLRVYNTF